MLIGESNVAIDPAIGGYGVADIYLGEFSPHELKCKKNTRLYQIQAHAGVALFSWLVNDDDSDDSTTYSTTSSINYYCIGLLRMQEIYPLSYTSLLLSPQSPL